MKNNPKEILKQLMENRESVNIEQMDALVRNSIEFFNEYIELSKSQDKEKQERALKEILDFKSFLTESTEKISEETGLSPTELMQVVNNPANFSEDQKNSMDSINEMITEFNTSLMKEMLPTLQKGTFAKARRANKKNHLAI